MTPRHASVPPAEGAATGPVVADIPRSTILVPVPAAEPIVASWRARHDPAAAAGIPAHVTALYPFLSPARIDGEVERALSAIVDAFRVFDFQLVETGRFPRTLYVVPDHADVWRQLTTAIWRRFPECPPYGGRYETIVPHLTIADDAEADVIAEIEPRLASALPLRARASEVWLMESEDGRWRTRTVFTLRAS